MIKSFRLGKAWIVIQFLKYIPTGFTGFAFGLHRKNLYCSDGTPDYHFEFMLFNFMILEIEYYG